MGGTPVFEGGAATRPKRFNCLGCISLIIALTALVIAMLAWLGIPPPEALQLPLPHGETTSPAATDEPPPQPEGEAMAEEDQALGKIRSILAEINQVSTSCSRTVNSPLPCFSRSSTMGRTVSPQVGRRY